MTNKIEKILSDLELIESELSETDAFASVTLNPTLRWMKFVLTDDMPNENKQRVPIEEFSNLISTGIHMPLKMAAEEIKPGHDEAMPLGVITNLKQTNNKIIGLAALWSRERPEDVEYVINEYKAGRTPQISWEIPYTEIIMREDGVQDLTGICLRAATLVGLPAYSGRTPVLAVASTELEENWLIKEEEAAQWTRAYINDLPDSAFLYVEDGGKTDEDGKTVPRSLRHLPYKDANGKLDLPHLRNAIARLEQSATGEGWLSGGTRERLLAKARKILGESKSNLEESMDELETLKSQFDEAKNKITELEAQIAEKENMASEVETELTQLREFKANFDKEQEKAEKLVAIKAKFVEAGIQKEDEYFATNAEALLALDETSLNFMIQELVAFSQASNTDKTKTDIPNFRNLDRNVTNIKQLADALRARSVKK